MGGRSAQSRQTLHRPGFLLGRSRISRHGAVTYKIEESPISKCAQQHESHQAIHKGRCSSAAMILAFNGIQKSVMRLLRCNRHFDDEVRKSFDYRFPYSLLFLRSSSFKQGYACVGHMQDGSFLFGPSGKQCIYGHGKSGPTWGRYVSC